MSRFQGTNLPQDVGARKMGLDLLQKINTVAFESSPVGLVYLQWPGESEPVELWPGSVWQDITATQTVPSGTLWRRIR